MRRLLFAATLAALAGCSTQTAPTTPATQKLATEGGHDENDHDHGKAMAAHLGKHHALLTAHISSKTGNELDILIESTDKEPQPGALPLTKLTGTLKLGDAEYPLTFEPAPADERPQGEAAGTCSHFVAKAPLLKPDDTVTVTVETELDGRKRKATWKNFNVKKYTHHAD